ncbi:hypothetical protein JTB14_037607 [Gonioctena quinquepunctata]|nr:hypothetical protein JTB14_037607 [Gonioctena quinquepunctata]
MWSDIVPSSKTPKVLIRLGFDRKIGSYNEIYPSGLDYNLFEVIGMKTFAKNIVRFEIYVHITYTDNFANNGYNLRKRLINIIYKLTNVSRRWPIYFTYGYFTIVHFDLNPDLFNVFIEKEGKFLLT